MKSLKNLLLATAAMVSIGKVGEDAAVNSLMDSTQVPKGKPVRNTHTKAAHDHRKAKAKRLIQKASRKRNRAA